MAKITDPHIVAGLARRKKAKNVGDPAGELARQLTKNNISFVREFMFHPTRKWRSDFLLSHFMILAEVHGGIWSNNNLGHNRGSGIQREMIKSNEAQILGYKVFNFDSDQIKDGTAMDVITRAIHREPETKKHNHG
jgi:hypothetical protein